MMILFADYFATLKRELRHPPRELWIHTANTVVLNREVRTREGHFVD